RRVESSEVAACLKACPDTNPFPCATPASLRCHPSLSNNLNAECCSLSNAFRLQHELRLLLPGCSSGGKVGYADFDREAFAFGQDFLDAFGFGFRIGRRLLFLLFFSHLRSGFRLSFLGCLRVFAARLFARFRHRVFDVRLICWHRRFLEAWPFSRQGGARPYAVNPAAEGGDAR